MAKEKLIIHSMYANGRYYENNNKIMKTCLLCLRTNKGWFKFSLPATCSYLNDVLVDVLIHNFESYYKTKCNIIWKCNKNKFEADWTKVNNEEESDWIDNEGNPVYISNYFKFNELLNNGEKGN